MSASQTQARATGARNGLPLLAPRQDRAACGGQAGVRPAWWRRLCSSSFVLAGVTALIVWVAVAALLRQGRLETVLSAGGRARRASAGGAGGRNRDLRADLAGRTPSGAGPRPCSGRVLPGLARLVVIPLMTLLSVGAATLIGSHAPWIELRSTEHWPGWLLVPLTIVAMDGANWLAHYADHRLDPLWRFHALHHSQEELSVLTSFRAHPLMHTTGFLLATIPVVALMPARPIAPVLITIYVCIGTLQHANLRWTFGPLGRVLVSPAYHRLHHAPDTQDVNLGVVLTIWDVLAGLATFPVPRRCRGPHRPGRPAGPGRAGRLGRSSAAAPRRAARRTIPGARD